jgi:hypothetical protein
LVVVVAHLNSALDVRATRESRTNATAGQMGMAMAMATATAAGS